MRTLEAQQGKQLVGQLVRYRAGLKAKCPDSKFYDLFDKPYDSK